MNTKPLTSESIDFGIGLSRNSIIDKFILASSVFGFVYMGITLWRDFSMNIISANSSVNFITALIPTVLWFVRDRVRYNVKAFCLFFTFLIAGIKSVLLFGTFSNSMIIFFCFCCVILAGSLSLKWSFLFMMLLSIVIPLRGYLHIQGHYPIAIDPIQIVSDKSASWVQLYVTFILTASIITIGVSQLRLEVNKYITLLQNSIRDLEAANVQLIKEIELKSVYQEDLMISSRKFETLFQGSRDGVLLLSSKGRVLEANPAFCETVGYTLEELRQAESMYHLIDPLHRNVMIERFNRQIVGEPLPMLSDFQITLRNGTTVPLEINSNLILAEDEVMLMSTIRDISSRKKLEKEKFDAALEAEERERERFSKDLHDDLGPVFSTLNLYLQTLSKKETDISKKEVLDKLSGMVESAVKQVREISHNLSPYLLKDAGIAKAIAIHLAKIKESDTLRTAFTNTLESNQRIPHNVEVVIYRVFLELLNNTIKHSGADKVKISMSCSSQKVYFTYVDNGKGFDIDKMKENRSGIGLFNIDNRIKSLSGSIDYTHKDGEMTVDITIPVL